MKSKTLTTLLACAALSVMMVMSAAAEAATETVEEAATEAVTEAADDEENYDTGDASMDNVRNQDEIGENEILVVSFGTSFNDNRRLTIGAIEDAVEKAFPDWSVRRAFTAQIIIDHVEKRDGVHIDNVEEALNRAVDNGVKNLAVVPTHLMDGLEYKELEELLAGYADSFEKLVLGRNLIDTDEDFKAVAAAVADAMAEYDDGQTAIVLMGHGTEAASNAIYEKMQGVFAEMGKDNFYVGTVEAAPTVQDVLGLIKDKGYTKVVLRPLMVVAGDHANNDMADPEDPQSWYSIFTAEGYEVTAVLEGLGQLPAIQELYVAKAEAALGELN